MKVLILSSNTGEGHNSAAKAVEEALVARGDTCHTVDALEYLSKRTSDFICGWHVRLYRRTPGLFNMGYKVVERSQNGKSDTVFASFLKGGAEKLAAAVRDGGYDCVLSTHPFSAYMFTAAVKKCGLNVRSAFIATDYTCSPPVDKTLMDTYFIPHEDVTEEFTTHYIPEEKVVATGLPVRQEFYTRYSKAAAKRALGLPENKRNILLACGSMGCGPLKDLTAKLSRVLPDDVHLTVICGSNAKLKKKLDSLKFKRNNVRILGFTKHINYYMDSAELIVSKAGGITCTEAMVKRLPMVVINAVGGCESYNRTFFISNGGALETTGKTQDLVVRLLNNPKLLKQMSVAMDKIYPGNAALAICDYLHRKD